jgi:tetratricopeptide (TPR) repeat protein
MWTGKLVWDDHSLREINQKMRELGRPVKSYLNAWAQCLLKYEDFPASLQNARKYFERALTVAELPIDKAPNYLALALVEAIEGKYESAAEHLRSAEKMNVRDFAIKNLTGKASEDLGDELSDVGQCGTATQSGLR